MLTLAYVLLQSKVKHLISVGATFTLDAATTYTLIKLQPGILLLHPCNVYHLEPHFYVAKLGYAGVYLFFLFLLKNIDCGYSLEPPRRGGSNVYPQSMF